MSGEYRKNRDRPIDLGTQVIRRILCSDVCLYDSSTFETEKKKNKTWPISNTMQTRSVVLKIRTASNKLVHP